MTDTSQTRFVRAIAALTRSTGSAHHDLAEEGDRLQVNICPRQLKEGENQALTTPFSACSTATELDTELVRFAGDLSGNLPLADVQWRNAARRFHRGECRGFPQDE